MPLYSACFGRAAATAILGIAFSGTAFPQQDDLLIYAVSNSGANGFYQVVPQAGRAFFIAATPFFGTGTAIQVLPGNRSVALLTVDPTSPVPGASNRVVYYFDLDTRALVRAPLPLWPGSFLPDNLLVDQDGDLLFSFYRGGGLSRLDQNGYPVLKVPELGTSVVDLDTGDYVGLVPSGQLARVSYSGQVTTITSVNPALSYWKRVAQDPASGDFLIWDQNPASNQPRALFRATASGVVTTVGIAPPVVLNPIAVFSDPAPDREYVFPSGCAAGVCFPTSPIPGIYTMSRTTGQVSLLYSIGRDPAGNPLWAPLDMVRDRSRRLSTVKSALNRWDLLIDFPGDGNLPYVVLLSLSGIRPGVPLSDGRRLRLNPDPLTYLAGGGQVPGFTGLSGILDQAGRALGLLDASWFPPTTQGVPLWAVGITLDQAAPSGIRTISDTIVVQIR